MLEHESETDDSDVESSMVAWLDLPSSTPTPTEPSSSQSSFREAVTMAMTVLQNVRLSNIVSDGEDLHRKILHASTSLSKFLDAIMSNQIEEVKELDLFTSLVQPSFLAVLFAQRKIFHSLAAKAVAPGTRASTVICWVDELLTKLAETTVAIASGSFMALNEMSEAMKSLLGDDSLRAAAQLPEKWSMVPSLIGSADTSPAAKRLAIQLTFAVYVVGPQFHQYSIPWIDSNTIQAAELCKILDQYILTSLVLDSVTYSSQKIIDQTRLSYAMIVCLYAASDFELRRNQASSPFRPRSLSGLLDIIQLVLCPNTIEDDETLCITPCEHLDPAQVLLIQWSHTICWCWETWNDCRIADTEAIIRLTATWLYHLTSSTSTPFQDILNPHAILERSPSATNYAIIQVLHHSTIALLAGQIPNLSHETFFVVLSSSCRAIDHLFRDELIHGRTLAGAEITAKYLLGLFLLLDHQKLELKSTLLESLTLIDDGAFDQALIIVCEDNKLRCVERIEELVLESRRGLIRSAEPGNELSPSDADHIRLVLYFLILIWHSTQGRKRVQRQPILNFLSSLTNRLLRGDLDRSMSDHLRDAVVAGFCVLDSMDSSDPPIKSPKQEDIWKFALDAGCSNLIVTSSFAHYIMTTRHFPEPLSCAEAWDHLKDTLILILRRHFTEDEKPLALLVSLGICGALMRLLDADSTTVQFILNSPWTMSLCVELKSLLQTDEAQSQASRSEDDYCRLLNSQLAPIGAALINAIHSKLDSEMPKECIPKFQSRLVYHGRYPNFSLVLVPRSE